MLQYKSISIKLSGDRSPEILAGQAPFIRTPGLFGTIVMVHLGAAGDGIMEVWREDSVVCPPNGVTRL